MFKYLIPAAAIALASFGSSASAATIQVSGTDITVDCTLSLGQKCQGLIGGSITITGNGAGATVDGTAATLSGAFADLFDLGTANEEREAQALDFLINGIDDDEFVGADGSKTNAGGVDTWTITNTLAEYVVFKTGNPLNDGTNYFFMKLSGIGEITLFYDKNGETGGGLSHFTTFGLRDSGDGQEDPNPVPLPAGGILLLTGLFGLGAASRRRKRK